MKSSEEEVRLSKVLEKKELYQNSTEHFVNRNFLLKDSLDTGNKPAVDNSVKQGTYEKRVEPLDFGDLLQNNISHSEITQTSDSGSDSTNNKPNLIDNINLSSSTSENIGTCFIDIREQPSYICVKNYLLLNYEVLNFDWSL